MAGEFRLLRFSKGIAAGVSAILLASIVVLTTLPAQSQSVRGGSTSADNLDWGILLFGGRLSKNAFGRTLNPFSPTRQTNIFVAGAALSRKLYTGSYFNIEAEIGAGYQFSSQFSGNNSPQVWGAFYLRYKYFPWNKFLYTTVAINTGLNYSFRKTAFESMEGRTDGTSNILNYLAPEITFALPDRRDLELVFRLHHRSGIYGLLGCSTCGTNFVSVGFRKRF